MNRPPARLLSCEASDELFAALTSAEDDASGEAIDRVRSRLSGALGPSFEQRHQPSGQPVSAGTRAARMLSRGGWLGLGAILALGAAWFGVGVSVARRPQPLAAEAHTVVVGAVASPPSPPQPLQPLQPRAAPVGSVESTATAATKPQVPLTAAKPATRGVKRNAVRSAPGELGLAEELRQLAQIRQQLSVSPGRALAEAEAQEQRFPHGTLGAERELLRIDALLRLGRVADARKLAARSLSVPGPHPYRVQIEKLLAGT